MKKDNNILASEKLSIGKKTMRNSCLLITGVILILLIAFAYVSSKELANAFKTVDEGLVSKFESYELSNDSLKNELINHSEFWETVQLIEKFSENFNQLMDSTINQLIIQTGGWKEDTNPKELANPKNYGVPSRILVTENLGDKIGQSITSTSAKYNEILRTELGVDTIQLPLKLNMDHVKGSGKTWTEFNFNKMPLMAVLPILRKIKIDENESKSIIYKYMANKK